MTNRRGKLKEHIEGIHRNCEWIKEHCSQAVTMIDDPTHQLDRAFTAIATQVEQLDQFAMELYSQF